MRDASPELAERINSGRMTPAYVLYAKLKDGTEIGFSGCDRDLEVDGFVYEAGVAADLSDIESTASLEISNLELNGMAVAPSITRAALLAGDWDNAVLQLGLVDAEFPQYGMIILQSGWIGEVTYSDSSFRAVFNGLKFAYKTTLVECTSATCRATLGDARCGVDLSSGGSPSYLATGEVETIQADGVTILDAARTEPAHPSGVAYYVGGKITFLTGGNAGRSMEVRSASSGKLVLGMRMPAAIQVGDTYEITPGCSKLLEDCDGTFGNVVNFRGEPHLAGNDRLFQRGTP